MLFNPYYTDSFASQVASFGTTRPAQNGFGTTVTPGTASEGAWAAVGSALTADCYAIMVNVTSAFTASTPRNYVLDVGVDPAGGTAYSAVITDLLCGGAQVYITNQGITYTFPLFIPSGSTLAARAQGTNATAFSVYFITYHRHSEGVRVGSYAETIGVTPGAILGTAITPGTTNEGAWTSIGTTVKNLWAWQFMLQVDASDTAWTSGPLLADLAVGDGTNFDIITDNLWLSVSSSEATARSPLSIGTQRFVPAGSTMYVRAQSQTTLDTYTAAVYGVGG